MRGVSALLLLGGGVSIGGGGGGGSLLALLIPVTVDMLQGNKDALISVARQVLLAVHALHHKKLVWRDIKPEVRSPYDHHVPHDVEGCCVLIIHHHHTSSSSSS
jgi:hypothetical protein